MSIEILMSRYAYAFSVLKSCGGHICQLREEMRLKNKERCVLLIKDIVDRLRNATIRLYKLKESEMIVLVIAN